MSYKFYHSMVQVMQLRARTGLVVALLALLGILGICFPVYAISDNQDKEVAETKANDPEVYKISRCQKILTKIDKLTLEVKQLKSEEKQDKKRHSVEVRRKIVTLNKQIARYKIEAKSICDKNLLGQTPWKGKAKAKSPLEESAAAPANGGANEQSKTSN